MRLSIGENMNYLQVCPVVKKQFHIKEGCLQKTLTGLV